MPENPGRLFVVENELPGGMPSDDDPRGHLLENRANELAFELRPAARHTHIPWSISVFPHAVQGNLAPAAANSYSPNFRDNSRVNRSTSGPTVSKISRYL